MADPTLKLGTEVPGTSAEGNITTIWVPAIADIKHPTIAELNAGTDISNYVTLGGWSFDPSQDTVEDQRENTTQDFGAPGRKSAGDISIEVIDNTNTLHEKDGNAAVELLHEGAEGFIVRRRGMATDAPLEAGQKLTVVAVIAGEKHVINPDANTMIRSNIPLFAKAPGWESETAELTDGATTVTTTAVEIVNADGSAATKTVTVGAKLQLAAKVTKSDKSTTLVTNNGAAWDSSDKTKATVGSDGTVTAVAAGTSTVSATVDGVTATLAVTVNAAASGK